mgnify:CR=1 FL=1
MKLSSKLTGVAIAICTTLAHAQPIQCAINNISFPAHINKNQAYFAYLPDRSPQYTRDGRFRFGPYLYNLLTSNSTNPDAIALFNAFNNASQNWQSSNAANILLGWDNQQAIATPSDCPTRSNNTADPMYHHGNVFQIGVYSFSDSSNCQTAVFHSANLPENLHARAFVDYYYSENTSDPSACTFPKCGTKSISLNLSNLWSWDWRDPPIVGSYDIESIMTHEFGHVLGLEHMDYGLCRTTTGQETPGYNATSELCSNNNNKETMANFGWPVQSILHLERCQKSPSSLDLRSIQYLYP